MDAEAYAAGVFETGKWTQAYSVSGGYKRSDGGTENSDFENRFPAKERLWGKAGDDDDITNYENSIRYTDGVLSRFKHIMDYGLSQQ